MIKLFLSFTVIPVPRTVKPTPATNYDYFGGCFSFTQFDMSRTGSFEMYQVSENVTKIGLARLWSDLRELQFRLISSCVVVSYTGIVLFRSDDFNLKFSDFDKNQKVFWNRPKLLIPKGLSLRGPPRCRNSFDSRGLVQFPFITSVLAHFVSQIGI